MYKKTIDEAVAVITAKTAFFFAKCDGDYDMREKNFIHNYLHLLVENQLISEEVQLEIKDIENQNLNIDSIISETKELIVTMSDSDKEKTIDGLSNVIKAVINADNVLEENEVENFEKWKETLKI